MRNLHTKIMAADIAAINRTLSNHKIGARVPARTLAEAKQNCMIALSSHCAYRIAFEPGVAFAKLESINRELSAAVSAVRVRAGFRPELSLRFQPLPMPMIEIDSPVDRPLALPGDVKLDQWCGGIGLSFGFQGKRAEVLDLAKHHQTFLAAMSGHGKSTVMRSVLSTMMANTSPENLRVILIDLKNEDLVPFQRAPHTLRYAGNIADAVAAIEYVKSEKQRRIDSSDPWTWRLLVVIDELAILNDGKNEERPGSVRYELAEVMNTGRSLGIGVFAASQYTTSKQIGHKIARAATHRITGHVDSQSSAFFATGQKGTGAERLEKLGAFLRVQGAVTRVQTYHSTLGDTVRRVTDIRRRWHAATPAAPAVAVQAAPVAPVRDAVDELADRIAPMVADGASKNAMSKATLGKPFAGSYAVKINAALERLAKRDASTTTRGDDTTIAPPPEREGPKPAVVEGKVEEKVELALVRSGNGKTNGNGVWM